MARSSCRTCARAPTCRWCPRSPFPTRGAFRHEAVLLWRRGARLHRHVRGRRRARHPDPGRRPRP
ncbi:hypothetical protein C7Y72_11355 [Paraconexibacter algicola]|uniref:Uncharacterized protein n=1 Tax=Paraconexibacter algicola TaxID=2133960 RepID=A0A2T4ULQ4_9ACTN|nr:hypothetical protein C7Y72_11355 [Paraconexibacter algicola]